MNYWTQRASTWVSMAVLCGGFISACLLVFIYKVETNIEPSTAIVSEEDLIDALKSFVR